MTWWLEQPFQSNERNINNLITLAYAKALFQRTVSELKPMLVQKD